MLEHLLVHQAKAEREPAQSTGAHWEHSAGGSPCCPRGICLSLCPAPSASGKAGLTQAALVSSQEAALKYLPSTPEDVWGLQLL